MPGYDAAQKDGAAAKVPQFDKTTVMSKPGAGEQPQAGGGNKTGQEP